MARQYRERAMAGIITPISYCEEYLPIRGSCASHLAYGSARARWGRNEAMPELQNILLEQLQPSGPVREGIAVGRFVIARQFTSPLPAGK
jgi:hypothetical protein